jgi:hypothetical protein
MTRATNRRRHVEIPQVYFRVVHKVIPRRNGTPKRAETPPSPEGPARNIPENASDTNRISEFREQVVEVALGPDRAFENNNIGRLVRRIPADYEVSAVPPERSKKTPPRKPKTPNIIGLLKQAIEWQRRLDAGEAESQADIARRESLTHGRVSQLMSLLDLSPLIQEHILSMPKTIYRPAVTERSLRPIVRMPDHDAQFAAFLSLLDFEVYSQA